MRKVARLIRLDGAKRRMLMRGWLCLAVVRTGLWLLPFRTVRGFVVRRLVRAERTGRQDPVPTTPGDAVSEPAVSSAMGTRREERRVAGERVVWAVDVGSRYVPRATCLTRALAAQWLLADPEVTLRVGVQRDSRGRLEAHAWLEYDGRIIVGAEQRAAFVPLPPLPGEAR